MDEAELREIELEHEVADAMIQHRYGAALHELPNLRPGYIEAAKIAIRVVREREKRWKDPDYGIQSEGEVKDR